jgi:hypothetical protein
MLALRVLQSDGLTFSQVLEGIPHDLPALFVYLLIAGFVSMIWLGSRRKPHT